MNKFAFHSLSYLIEAPYYFLPVLLNHYDKSPHDLSTLRVADKPELLYTMLMAFHMSKPHRSASVPIIRRLRHLKVSRNGGRAESQRIFRAAETPEDVLKLFWSNLIDMAHVYRNGDGKWCGEIAATFGLSDYDDYIDELELYRKVECPSCGTKETSFHDEGMLEQLGRFRHITGPYCRCPGCGSVVRPEVSAATELPDGTCYGDQEGWTYYVDHLAELLGQMEAHVSRYGRPSGLRVDGRNLDWRGRDGHTFCSFDGLALAEAMSVRGDFRIADGKLWLRADGTAEMTCSMYHHDVPTGSSLVVQPAWECELDSENVVTMQDLTGNGGRCWIAETLLCGGSAEFEFSEGSTFKVVSPDGLIDSIEYLSRQLGVKGWEDENPHVATSSQDLTTTWTDGDALGSAIGWLIEDLVDRLRADDKVNLARVKYLRGLIDVFLVNGGGE